MGRGVGRGLVVLYFARFPTANILTSTGVGRVLGEVCGEGVGTGVGRGCRGSWAGHERLGSVVQAGQGLNPRVKGSADAITP